MTDSREAMMAQWETKTLKVATPETLYSYLFSTLLYNGHFSVDAATFATTPRLSTARDQALVEALTNFVAEIPVPRINDSREQFLRFGESAHRVEQLVAGPSNWLVKLITETPTLSYAKWPEWLIIASEEEIGWTLESKQPMLQDGIIIGTIYTFRRLVAGTQVESRESILADADGQRPRSVTWPEQPDATGDEQSAAERKFDQAMGIRKSKPAAAVQALQDAITLEPGFGMAYRELGKILFQLGQYEDALQRSQQAAELMPNDAEAWALYGDRCVSLFHVDQALGAYEHALMLDPDHLGANKGFGGVLTRMIEAGKARDRIDEAERCLQRAMALEPSDNAPYLMLGCLYKATGNLEKARLTYKRWLEIHPDNPVPLRELTSLGPEKASRGIIGGLFRRRKEG